MQCATNFVFLFAGFHGSFRYAAGLSGDVDETQGVCKDDSSAASCTDEISLMQLNVQMKGKEKLHKFHQHARQEEERRKLEAGTHQRFELPMAMSERCAPRFQKQTERLGEEDATDQKGEVASDDDDDDDDDDENENVKQGAKWRQAIKEAGLKIRDISLFGHVIPKFTAAEVTRLTEMSRKGKKYSYNFIGSVCDRSKRGTIFNIVGGLPPQSKRYRRTWVMNFAKYNFSAKDFFKITDPKECEKYNHRSDSDSYRFPIGTFDRTLSPEDPEEGYFNVLAASNFTLCPGGDEPWSMRVYEAVGAGSLPVVLSQDHDLSAKARGDLFGIAIQAVQDLFHVGFTHNATHNQQMVEENRRTFIKYHTFMEGDNVPPGLDLEAQSNYVLYPSREISTSNRAKKEKLCVDYHRTGMNEIKPGLGKTLQDSSFQVARVSEKPLIMGAGIGSTGTRSVKQALEMLGETVWHCAEANGCNVPAVTNIMAPSYMGNLFSKQKKREMSPQETESCLKQLSTFDYTDIPKNVTAILDTPVAEVFLYMWRSFPNARVILTNRNASEWVSSRISEHNYSAFIPIQNPCGQFMEYPASSKLSRHQLEELFDLHTGFVKCIVPQNQLFRGKSTLPEIDLAAMGDNQKENLMSNLAKFLGMSPPERVIKMDFPHVSGPNE